MTATTFPPFKKTISSGPSSCLLVVPCGFSSCGVWDLSSPSRDQTHVPCVMGQIPNPWITREVHPKLSAEVPLVYQFSCSVVSDSLRPHGRQHTRLPCPSPIPRVCSNSCPSSRWCHPAISPLLSPSPPALNLPQHQGLFWWVSSSNQLAKVVEFQFQNQAFQWIFIQDWFPLGWTGLLSLQSKGLWRVFSNTTVQKHQFFGTQLSLWSKSHIHTWLLEKS